jgi:6-phosphofructokinase 1
MRIGVFCSGGDAPGMNACLRGIVRCAITYGHEVVGINRGYQGILDEDFYGCAGDSIVMDPRSVSGIVKHGGTILRSSRSDEFRTDAGQQRAASILRKHQIDALVPIGGDGTIRGAMALSRFWDGKIIACPGTIDNDLWGTDYTIGFHTAVNTAVEAVDKIRDTAESHEMMFLIEVMGRHSGYIAVYTALAGGAECVCIPETCTEPATLVAQLRELQQRGKSSIMLIVAEGDERGGAKAIDELLREAGNPFPTRLVVLGHLQRGGSPVPIDRILAGSMGDFAVRSLIAGETLQLSGIVGGENCLTPFTEAVAEHKPIPPRMLELLSSLSH